MSLTKKLVEKDVEVTVVEKRVITMYEYQGEEYTKYDLLRRLRHQISSTGDRALSYIRECNGLAYSTSVSCLLKHTNWMNWIEMSNRLKEIVELYEELQKEE